MPRSIEQVAGAKGHREPAAAETWAQRVRDARLTIGDEEHRWGIETKIPLHPFVEAVLRMPDPQAAAILAGIEQPAAAELKRASQANRIFAAQLVQVRTSSPRPTPKAVLYPADTLFCHSTKLPALLHILRSANFDRLFILRSAEIDETPGQVDLAKIEAKHGKKCSSLQVNPVASDFGGIAILYDARRLDPSRLSQVMSDGVRRDWQHAVGIPNTAICALQISSSTRIDPPQLAEIKQILVQRGLYVPILSATGDLVFSHDEWVQLVG